MRTRLVLTLPHGGASNAASALVAIDGRRCRYRIMPYNYYIDNVSYHNPCGGMNPVLVTLPATTVDEHLSCEGNTRDVCIIL